MKRFGHFDGVPIRDVLGLVVSPVEDGRVGRQLLIGFGQCQVFGLAGVENGVLLHDDAVVAPVVGFRGSTAVLIQRGAASELSSVRLRWPDWAFSWQMSACPGLIVWSPGVGREPGRCGMEP